MNEAIHPSRQKFIQAAIALVREQGYAATSVDDICTRAGIGKGSFFHHFKSKEELLLASIEHWNAFTGERNGASIRSPSAPMAPRSNDEAGGT